MKHFYLLSILAILLACCTNPSQSEALVEKPATLPVAVDRYPGNTKPTPTVDDPMPAPADVHPLELIETTAAGVPMTVVAFDTRKYTLEVSDKEAGPDSEAETAQAAAKGAVAVINGGFFTPKGEPLGLVYEHGRRFGFLNKSSLGSGVLYIDKKLARPVLARRQVFEKWLGDSLYEPYHVLQGGPFLVEDYRAVAGLENDEARVRSFLLWDGQTHFAIAQCEAITLRNLAGALAEQPLKGFSVHSALNLDGGRSAELYLSEKLKSGPRLLRRWWNKPVRNYLLLKSQ